MNALTFSRLLLLLVSLKYPRIVKLIPYYELSLELIHECGLPKDRGLEGDSIVILRSHMSFILYYFNWFPTAIMSLIVYISNIVAWKFLYDK